jgi:hypothetical protein
MNGKTPKNRRKTAELRKRLGAGGGEIGKTLRVRISPHLRKAASALYSLFLVTVLLLFQPMIRPMLLGILSFLFAAKPQNRLFLLLLCSNIFSLK